jgi:hypothetical protein
MVTFVLYTGNIGDGSYLMGTNGINYTHAEKEDNQKWTELKFKTGDEVTVEFDPARRTVAYIVANNEGYSKRYNQSIRAAELFSDPMHFCV